MHPSQDGEIPFDQEVALTMLERGWDRVMAISDTLDDWTDFSSDYAQGLTHLNRFKEFSLSNSTYKSDPDISFCNPFDSPLTATAFSREGSFLHTSTTLAKIPPPIIHKDKPPERRPSPFSMNFTTQKKGAMNCYLSTPRTGTR